MIFNLEYLSNIQECENTDELGEDLNTSCFVTENERSIDYNWGWCGRRWQWDILHKTAEQIGIFSARQLNNSPEAMFSFRSIGNLGIRWKKVVMGSLCVAVRCSGYRAFRDYHKFV